VNEIKEVYHPNAYLQRIKNVKSGLKARTMILNALDKGPSEAAALTKETGRSYRVVMHHLRLLEIEGIINRKGKSRYSWSLTGMGQKRLVD
jgi:DNA-binding HxlR family transcriptional regulator